MTKAETLLSLRGRLEYSRIAELDYFTYAEWRKAGEEILLRLQSAFTGRFVIVRSSAQGEDGHESSMAGQFCSLLNIDSQDKAALASAVVTVFNSYPDNNKDHQVLVQPMIQSVLLSGVVFTQDQKTGAPYIIISYDDESPATDAVTSGRSVCKSLRIWRGTAIDKLTSERMQRLYKAVQELEALMQSDSLDIEFAIDADYRVWILQVRPLIMDEALSRQDIRIMEDVLQGVCRKITHLSKPQEGIYGVCTLFSNMSDWNPAEMIGITPYPLAYSLYHTLITADIWHQARSGMGYYPVEHHLMEKIGGQPFIDVRKSFNSFLPAQIAPLTAERLINAWLARLAENPALYDKVEFDIASTCYTPSFERFYAKHYEGVLTEEQHDQYRNILLDLTAKCVSGDVEYSLGWCEAQAEYLKEDQQKIALEEVLSQTSKNIAVHIAHLIGQGRLLGTQAFSAAARHAFIAEAILRGGKEEGYLSADNIARFKSSITTISNDIIHAMAHVQENPAAREAFNKKFGHIRPSSYDILSPRYDAMDNIGGIAARISCVEEKSRFDLSELAPLDDLFARDGFPCSMQDFATYYIKAVQLRESIKLTFTRSLSDILECVAAIGAQYDLDRHAMSYMDVNELIKIVTDNQPGDKIRHMIEKQKHEREIYKGVYMNYLLESEKDIYVIPVQRNIPNFITFKRVSAPCETLSENEAARHDLAGKIICIERADPGFDWLFGCGIAGLVTQYGGANSHMAIRCSEFGLPAAIGCGELIYEKLKQAGGIEMDCQSGTIVPLSA